ncbi:MAG TPA: transporter substrate-binding domain-containing protein [Actinomycetota bacterium]|nr:transporter substrate-binding domain-containing protein [Actinomycetota bacterium]
MRRSRFLIPVVLTASLTLVAAACSSGSSNDNNAAGGGGDTASPAAQGTCASVDTSSGDLLARICQNGEVRVSTDPAYPPQSSYDEATGQWEGFDIDAAEEIAKRMGVQVAWKTPSWDLITAGGWNDRWDLSVGSMTITKERAQVLDFSTPYYYTPAGLAVRDDSDITSFDQLAGKTIGACSACTYEFYLERKLDIPGYTFDYLVPANIKFVGYDTDSTAIQDLVLGRLDAAMSAVPTLQGAIDKGKPIKLLGDPVFYEPLAAAADKSAPLDPTSFIQQVSDIIQQMHDDGTLTHLSMKWYGEDITKPQA